MAIFRAHQCRTLESNPLSVNGHAVRIKHVFKQQHAAVANSIPACSRYVSGDHKVALVWIKHVAYKT